MCETVPSKSQQKPSGRTQAPRRADGNRHGSTEPREARDTSQGEARDTSQGEARDTSQGEARDTSHDSDPAEIRPKLLAFPSF